MRGRLRNEDDENEWKIENGKLKMESKALPSNFSDLSRGAALAYAFATANLRSGFHSDLRPPTSDLRLPTSDLRLPTSAG
jgi:hypothetical protein